MQPDLILVPFAQDAPAANVDAIPVSLSPSDPPQAASWSQGFPTVTMTPLAAGGIPPRGQSFNGVLQDITQHLVYIGGGGQYRWSSAYVAAKGGYSIGDVIQADSGLLSYVSLVDNNTDNFNTTPASIGPKWRAWAGGDAPNATTTQRGAVLLATQSQVNSGSGDAVVTPETRAIAYQNQAAVAFSSTGTSTAQILTPSPAIPAYTKNLRFNVNFNVASGLNPAINVSGIGVKNLKQYDSSGAKVSAVFAAGQNSDIVYDGTDWVLIDQLPVTATQRRQSLRGAAINWKASANGISANIVCSADSVVLANTAGDSTVVDTIALTLNTAVAASATVDGMASGAVAANTWYGIYVWANSTTGVKRITGDSAYTTGLAPTPPAAGFDIWARRSAFKTDASSKPMGFTQSGDHYTAKVDPAGNVPQLPILGTGVVGSPTTPTFVAIPILSVVAGPSAKSVIISVQISNGGIIIAAPNNKYAGVNAPFTDNSSPVGGAGQATTFLVSSQLEILLEGANIYWASQLAANGIRFIGWKDQL